MVKFENLRFKNFLSYGNTFTEIQLDKTSTTLIQGANGAGKSTFIDALCYALFGKPFRNINKNQLVNSINLKDCIVEVEFSIGKKDYMVRRGIKPSIFEIYVNGKMLDQSANKRDHQEYLEKGILKLNKRSFCQIVVLGSTSFIPFMELKTSERRKIIEDLLDIEIFSSMNLLLRGRNTDLRNDLIENDHEIDLVKSEIEIHNEYMENLKKNVDKEIQDKKEDITKNENQIGSYEEDNTSKNKTIDALKKTISDLDSVTGKKSKLEVYEDKFEKEVKKLSREITFFKQNSDCPTCTQSIEEEFKLSQITGKEKKVGEFSSALEALEEKFTEVNTRLSEIIEVQRKMSGKQLDINENNNSIIAIQRYIEKVRKNIEGLRKNKSGMNAEDKKKIDKLNNKVGNLKDKLSSLLGTKEIYDIASELLKDTGIKTAIIKQYIPVMNKIINKYLKHLDFYISFNFDENFKEEILSRHRDDFTYASFSEGEKMRINIALLLTWRKIARMKNSVNTNLLVLDETFDSSLDSDGTEELIKILDEFENSNVFVISHKSDILLDKFDTSITFEKQKGFSRKV